MIARVVTAVGLVAFSVGAVRMFSGRQRSADRGVLVFACGFVLLVAGIGLW